MGVLFYSLIFLSGSGGMGTEFHASWLCGQRRGHNLGLRSAHSSHQLFGHIWQRLSIAHAWKGVLREESEGAGKLERGKRG